MSIRADSTTNLEQLMDEIIAFRDERDWAQFHSPANLAIALGIEVAELQELMLWKSNEEVKALASNPETHNAFAHEIADVLIYALLFARTLDIDPLVAIREKLSLNAQKYPVDKSRGKSDKYSTL